MQPFLVLPDGRTVSEWLTPQIEAVYRQGEMPPMLPGLEPQGKQLMDDSDIIAAGK
jgi:hypothetical protein